MKNIYEASAENKRKSFIIVMFFVLFTTLSVWVISQAFGYWIGYDASGFGMVGIAFIISGLMSFTSYYFSDRIILTISKARPADRKREFEYYTAAENISLASGLPKPKLYVIEDSAMNAFATGRDPEHAVVAATTGLIHKLDKTELEAVVAHEMSHIGNYDARLMSIVAVMVGTIVLTGDIFIRTSFLSRGNRKGNAGAVILIMGIVFAILSPIVAKLIQLSISRRREFFADASAVALTRQPSGMISALKKLSENHDVLEVANRGTAHLYIVNPFKDMKSMKGRFSALFNTHPPIEDRIKALEQMV